MKLLYAMTISVVFAVGAGAVVTQDFDKGVAAYRAGDYAAAVKSWCPLAEQRDAYAQYNLGVMYSDARGVPQDYKEALKLFTLAAKQGDAMAQFNVGVTYRNGWGVVADYVVAHMWYDISATNGLEIAAGNREKLAKKMTSEDISKAQALARVCTSSNYEKCGY